MATTTMVSFFGKGPRVDFALGKSWLYVCPGRLQGHAFSPATYDLPICQKNDYLERKNCRIHRSIK